MGNPNKAVVVLPAADGMGVAINGSHRTPIAEIRAVSPLGDGTYSVVYLERVNLVVALSAAEVGKLLGWD